MIAAHGVWIASNKHMTGFLCASAPVKVFALLQGVDIFGINRAVGGESNNPHRLSLKQLGIFSVDQLHQIELVGLMRWDLVEFVPTLLRVICLHTSVTNEG